jgi:hypothetical protein
MTDELEKAYEPGDFRPNEGDLVRMVHDPDGQVMWVRSSALGEDHNWEGVRNGIYCEWVVDGETVFEVFQPGQLVVVQPAAVTDSPQ